MIAVCFKFANGVRHLTIKGAIHARAKALRDWGTKALVENFPACRKFFALGSYIGIEPAKDFS
jgi:hypothetical protein